MAPTVSLRQLIFWILLLVVVEPTICFALALDVESDSQRSIEFNRDVRPILAAKCFSCHGPDTNNQESEFRVDSKDAAYADLGGYFAVVPGKPHESELIRRITSEDPDEIMPPSEHKDPLTKEEVLLLKLWIDQGAAYTKHWSFEAVMDQPIPATQQPTLNAVDHFVGSRLDEENLSFSPLATAETLYRRLRLDLTGLPPELDELDRFLDNPSEEAFRTSVDELMNTPAFAEHMATEWLDVARYADTNGYSIDDHRDMWVWRDWVINAFQTNQPYDEFIRHQIAGDLIDGATDRTRIATGFLRNSMNTHEGGTIAEEYRVAAIADKIDAVSTAFLGLTMKCAQCHDHKYDALSQRDYYRFFAFFNSSSEPGNGAYNGNTKPFLNVKPILQSDADFRSAIVARIQALEYFKTHPEEYLGDASQEWEQEKLAAAKEDGDGHNDPIITFSVPEAGEARGLSWIWTKASGRGELAWFRRTFEIESIPDSAKLFVSCDNEAEIWVNGKYIGRNPDWQTPSVFELKESLVIGENLVAIAAKDWEQGEAKAALLALIALPENRYIVSDDRWLVSEREIAGWNERGVKKGFVSAAIVAPHGNAPWGNTFSRLDPDSKTTAGDLLAALRRPRSDRTTNEQKLIADAFAKSNSGMAKLVNSIDGEIEVLRKSLKTGTTTVMVMDQSKPERKTPILIRGQYDLHGDIVTAGIPKLFGVVGTRTDRTLNRLDMANWLVDPANPLTARVTVNRYWQMLFGVGLVKTTEDFGVQGDWPSHPELLDYLAKKFVDSGWDVRALLKEMLMSRTYRQSSRVTKELYAKDPNNRWLARAPRYRLSAESIRDSAFQLGGLLDHTLGGPSVYPPQPKGLWKEVSHFGHPTFFSAQHFYADQTRQQIFRRSMYTFWKRTSPPPVMMTFDAPNRETCTVRRSRTNTPLQALVLMNEPQFVEASFGLAKRMLDDETDLDGQIRFGFRLATARFPTSQELQVLRKSHQRQLEYFGKSEKRASDYVAGRGDFRLAAMMSVAALILNLDETITRE